MRRERVLTAICLLLMTTAAAGQNLVMNGDFDVGIEGWEAQPTPPGMTGTIKASHDPVVDALDIADSGSLVLEWYLTDPSGTVPNGQRILQTCSNTALPAGGVLIPTGFAGEGLSSIAGEAFLLFCDYPDLDCSGGSSCGVRSLPTTPGIIFNDGFSTADPSGSQSVGVELIVEFELDGSGDSISEGSVRLDKVFLREEVQPDLIAAIELLGTAGLTASFGGIGMNGQSPFQRVFSWDFGDGIGSNEQNPTHTYASPGTYLVTLTVDTGFSQAVDQVEVTVTGSATEIPTVSSVGLAVLAAILGLGGIILLRGQGLFPGS